MHFITNRTAIGVKATPIIITILLIYYQDLNIIFHNALQDESVNYVIIIPFLFVYLIYRKKKMLRTVVSFETSKQHNWTKHFAAISGILLIGIAMLLYWYGSSTFSALEYHLITLPILAAGLILILFNLETLRQLAFPIAFLAFLTPPPSLILSGFGSTLSVISSEASSKIVNVVGINSTISSEYGNPVIILTRPDHTTLEFMVDIACSGIYSLMGFLIYAVFMAYIIRDRAWKKATMFFIGLPLIYFLNITHISIILLIGYQYGEQLALQTFHLIGGYFLIFFGILLLLAISEKILKIQFFTKPQTIAICPECNSNTANISHNFCKNCGRLINNPKIYLKKLEIAKIAAIISIALLQLLLQVPVIALTKGPAPIIITTPQGEQGNTQLLPQIQGYNLQFLYRDKQFEQEAGQNASLLYLYDPQNTTQYPIFVGIEIASTHSALHAWEVCLITSMYQPRVTQIDLRDIQILPNPPIIARYFAFKYIDSNITQIVLYWHETSIFTLNNTVQQENVKISLIAYPTNSQDIQAVENQLLQFATAIVNYWEPMKTWSFLAIILSQYGDKLTIATSSMLSIPIIFSLIEARNKKNRNKVFYQKLSMEERQIINAIQVTKKSSASTLENIFANYTQNTTINNITKDKLLDILTKTEKNTRLISTKIVNWQDEPIQVWNVNLNRQILNL
jgi:exosortase